ncbi:MAG: alpha/beta hydrolase [Peptococcaceae bacterium]|nr:alpha/beta hydrolase [Peptococcaceae bacterium]
MEKKCITSENGAVWYWIDRHSNLNAPWIVFTHGLAANHTMFDRQLGHFAKTYSVITWDVPFHGESKPYKHFSFANAAKELNAILAAEDIPKTILVGMSMGGYVSQQFIDAYPEKVSAFIALDTTPFGLRYYSRSDLFWQCHAGAMSAGFPDKTLRRNFAKANALSEEGRRLMLQMLAPMSKSEICLQMSLSGNALYAENHDIDIPCPVLIIVGEKDRTGKVPQYCKTWSEATGYPLVWIPNAAHLSNVDNWQDVNRAIEAFITPLTYTKNAAASPEPVPSLKTKPLKLAGAFNTLFGSLLRREKEQLKAK